MKKITITSLISILFVILISCNNSTPICIDICHGNVIAIDNSSLEKLEGFTLAELNTDKIIKFKTIGDVGITVSFFAKNLMDERARNHTSFVKNQVPLAGRNIGFKFNITF